MYVRIKIKKSLTDILSLSRTNILIRGTTLIHGILRRALLQDTIISLMFNAHHYVAEYSAEAISKPAVSLTSNCPPELTPPELSLTHPRLTAPSAVHLLTCFSPDSHHRRLSVEASSALSPLHRFSLCLFYHGKISLSIWGEIFFSFNKPTL